MTQKQKLAAAGLTVVCVLVVYAWLGRFECFEDFWRWPEHNQIIHRHTFELPLRWFRGPLALVIGGAVSGGLYLGWQRLAGGVGLELEDVIRAPGRIREIREEQKKDKKP